MLDKPSRGIECPGTGALERGHRKVTLVDQSMSSSEPSPNRIDWQDKRLDDSVRVRVPISSG